MRSTAVSVILAGALWLGPAPALAEDVVVRIQPGQTLYGLAQTYYGNGMLFDRICDANPNLRDCALLEIGTRITIPAPTQSPVIIVEPAAPTAPQTQTPETTQAEGTAEQTAPQTQAQDEAPAGPENLARQADEVTNDAVWFAQTTQNGLTIERIGTGVTDAGLAYADYRVRGTPTTSFAGNFYRTGLSLTPAGQGETFKASGWLQALDGDPDSIGALVLLIAEQAESNSFAGFDISRDAKTSDTLTRVEVSRTMQAADTNQTRTLVILVGLNPEKPVDFSFRAAGLRLERVDE